MLAAIDATEFGTPGANFSQRTRRHGIWQLQAGCDVGPAMGTRGVFLISPDRALPPTACPTPQPGFTARHLSGNDAVMLRCGRRT